MEQHIILIISALTLAVTIVIFFIDQRRRLSKRVRNYILEKMDKMQYSCKRSHGNLFYISNRDIYDELEEMVQVFKNDTADKTVSEELLNEMNKWFPFARFRNLKTKN